MAKDAATPADWRLQMGIYLCGLFSNSMSNLLSVVLPLWVVTLNPSPTLIGVVLGSRTFLPLLLSIHGGAVMDKVGARRIIFIFSVILIVFNLLYPFASWIPFLIFIQMVTGLAATMGWIGAQTLIGQRLRGDPLYAGRLAFSTRFGILVGPPLIGAIWDIFGPTAAFLFMALWAAGILLGLGLLPKTHEELNNEQPKISWRDALPNVQDYLEAVRLMVIPAVFLVAVMSVLRVAGEAIMSSFYVIYLAKIGLSGTAIGIIMSALSICGGLSALLTGRMSSWIPPHWLMIIGVTLSVVLIAITPILGASFFILLAAISLRGIAGGTVQPLMLSIVSRATDRKSQGRAVGLRATANRLAMTFTPMLMGAVVEFAGLENAFLIVGAVLVVLLAGVAVYVFRNPAFASQN